MPLTPDGAWHVVAASVVGTSHLERGQPCQDAYEARITERGALLIAIADGAGTAARADVGALVAVRAAVDALEAELAQIPENIDVWNRILVGAFRTAREALQTLADAELNTLRVFATTLTCVVAVDGWLAVGQLGDAAVVGMDGAGALFLTVRPQRGEYANEAYFLTMPDALEWLEVWVASGDLTAVAATTDGLLRLALKLPDYLPHAPFFHPLWNYAAHADDTEQAQARLAEFLSGSRVNARTDDDKTLVLAVRTRHTGQG